MDLSRVSHLTRSGRCYAPAALRSETQQGKTSPIPQALKFAIKNSDSIVFKEPVNEKKAIKFYEKYGFSYCNEKKEFENSGFFMLKYAKNAIK